MSNLFPKSANKLPLQIIIFLFVLGGIATAGVTYYMTPKYTRVGYAPVQPVPFSHALHAGQLGLDCRYCHTGVDKGPASVVPTAQTCMNCHNQVKPDSPLLAVVRQSYETGNPVPWVKIHQVPDSGPFDQTDHFPGMWKRRCVEPSLGWPLPPALYSCCSSNESSITAPPVS